MRLSEAKAKDLVREIRDYVNQAKSDTGEFRFGQAYHVLARAWGYKNEHVLSAALKKTAATTERKQVKAQRLPELLDRLAFGEPGPRDRPNIALGYEPTASPIPGESLMVRFKVQVGASMLILAEPKSALHHLPLHVAAELLDQGAPTVVITDRLNAALVEAWADHLDPQQASARALIARYTGSTTWSAQVPAEGATAFVFALGAQTPAATLEDLLQIGAWITEQDLPARARLQIVVDLQSVPATRLLDRLREIPWPETSDAWVLATGTRNVGLEEFERWESVAISAIAKDAALGELGQVVDVGQLRNLSAAEAVCYVRSAMGYSRLPFAPPPVMTRGQRVAAEVGLAWRNR